MRLRELRDVYLHQDIYIVGSGPSANVFPHEFLADKICISLNDAYKMSPAITPVTFMHHETYARQGDHPGAPFHPYFENIKYPVVKVSGKSRVPDRLVDWENPHFYLFDWSHEIEKIWTMTKDTDFLYYTPEGCSLHAAMQLAWIMGARNVFILGCDSRTFGGTHYASYDKNGFRAEEVLPVARNYDSYVYGTLIVQEFLRRKGVQVFNLSSLVGYHLLDYQMEVLKGALPVESVFEKVKET